MLYLFGFVGSTDDRPELPDGVLGRPEIVDLAGDRGAVVAELSVDPGTWSDPSVIDACGALYDGTTSWRICWVSVNPVERSSSGVITSTGTGESTTVRSVVRPPRTMTSPEPTKSWASETSWVVVSPGRTVTVTRCVT